MKFRHIIYGVVIFAICTLSMWWLTNSNGTEHVLVDRLGGIRGKVVTSFNRNEVIVAPPVKKKIAYAITITKDGPFLDGALVLGYSAIKAQSISNKYTADLIALVTPEVTHARPILQSHGWKIIERDLPVSLEEIESTDYVRKVSPVAYLALAVNSADLPACLLLSDEGQRVLWGQRVCQAVGVHVDGLRPGGASGYGYDHIQEHGES